ncbi:VOC family protein [Hyphomonas sp. FCG-A18]|uniref:VOC family protein n=1 Tax=Hyphomonas sp. FCG-A18 TaxID=3080019 RepID=UPI002B2EE29D|nr:VOC family protein [Hyphomonas sp. FCG-A18]
MSVLPESRLSIITLGVRDRAAMTAFYEDIIGFKNVGPEGMAMFNMGGFVLGLWEADKLAHDAGQIAHPVNGFRNVALAYNARSEAEVDEIFERLKTAGVQITTEPHKAFWGGYSGYFADPEGNAWEVAFNPFWTFDKVGRVVLPVEAEA